MTEPDPIDNAATQFQDEGDEYVAWTPPPVVEGREQTPKITGHRLSDRLIEAAQEDTDA